MDATDDSVLYEDSFETMKVAELKAQLKARNLPTSGLRNELIARLQEAVAASKDSVDEEDDDDVDEDDDVEGDSTSEIPSQVSLFADSQLSEELQDDDILNDPDSPIKKHDSFSITISSSAPVPSSVSPNELKPAKTPLKPLKRTTTIVPSNGTAPSAKKICLTKVSSTHLEPVVKKSTDDVPLDSDNSASKSISLIKTMTPQEKLALRAKRFNLASTETTKLKVIGKTSLPLTTKSNITPISFESAPDMDKLKKRAERFGVVSTILKKIEEKDKVKQRLERFSTSGTVSLSKDEDTKRKQRMQRFGTA